MEQYIVTGMNCAACQARVEKAVSAVNGVESCSVSLLTNSMGVEGSASEKDIIAAVEKAGYGAKKKGASAVENSMSAEEDALQARETPVLKKRLLSSVIFLIILMYFSMGHKMLNWPVFSFMQGNHMSLALTEMLLAIIVMIINHKFFTSGFRSLFAGSPNMDTLVALGSTASFGYSLVELYLISDAINKGDMATAMMYHHNLYFESAAMIPALITVGKLLESISKGKTTSALKGLLKLAPKNATVINDNGQEETVSIDQVKVGDTFIVKPGESIPVDGVVIEGNSAVNEASLTGESIPVDKQEGDTVSAATINQSGVIRARATRVGGDTTLSKIIQMVSDASATKAEIARIADKVSGIFVPAVIIIATVTMIIWLLVGKPFNFAIARAISVLVISCPCALGLATPVAIMVGNGVGAKNGILFKTAVSLEETGKIDIVALDKTGTITSGIPVVTDIVPSGSFTEEYLMQLAGDIENYSEHPLAKAIVSYAREHNYTLNSVKDFEALPGNGIKAVRNDLPVYAGSFRFINTMTKADKELISQNEKLANQGKTPLYFVENGTLVGIIAVADTVKPESSKAIEQLRNMGIAVVMLTGDNEQTARAIGETAGVTDVIAGVLPNQKEEMIRMLQESGKVAMVGDGINDAPALTRADLGIAIGAGTDIAIDAGDIVLMKSNLLDVPAAIRLSKATLKNIYENLFWAFFYNIICIPLAAGFYQALFNLNWEMNPMIGAAAMSLSSFTVCMNALRLNTVKIYDTAKDLKSGKTAPELHIVNKGGNEYMTKTVLIEGMMCEHCQATVKKALEKIDGIASADVDYTTGKAVISLEHEVSEDVIKEAIEDRDYTFKGIE